MTSQALSELSAPNSIRLSPPISSRILSPSLLFTCHSLLPFAVALHCYLVVALVPGSLGV